MNPILNKYDLPQKYGDKPAEVRETEKYKEEYVHQFVEKWDELIDWEARGRGEGTFFIDELKKRNKRKVLDVATGTGYHSIKLLTNGFEVWSADGSPVMLAKAFENGRQRGHILKTIQADWRWLNRDVHGRFDAIICLGNSFTHLFSENDRRKTLAEFYSALRHDGILILDHRNYDSILDDEVFDNSHTYYYAGEQVKANPEYYDEGLARFRYEFPDRSVFHLNMFPLRVNYVQRLLTEVGFQHIDTYGDFQETHHTRNPDFYIHIAEKKYKSKQRVMPKDDLVSTTKNYYDSSDADSFYHTVWGGEDIHVGIYEAPGESISEASQRTVATMASLLPAIGPETRVLDIGAGYGGSARYLATHFGCAVTCLNLSETENERNREKNRQAGLEGRIRVEGGNFEDLPYADEAFDLVWSQDALLHSEKKDQVFREVSRVLKPGGTFLFTDPMQSDDCPEGVLAPIYERIHLKEMGSVGLYRDLASRSGFRLERVEEMPAQLTTHYSRVREELRKQRASLKSRCSASYIDKMEKGLGHWVEGGRAGYLNWGILHLKKLA